MLTGKTILVISPQRWGNMYLSKHHYAIELAKRGNTVYFLNPPDETARAKRGRIAVAEEGNMPGLWVIDHSLRFPYQLKFHAMSLFHLLMRPHVAAILKKIGRPVDVIWSFDLGNLYPFRFFGKTPCKIFHPVDEPLNAAAIRSGDGAQIVFAVTREILAKYEHLGVPGHFINHGVSAGFVGEGLQPWVKRTPVRVGLSGNWTRPDIDTGCLLRIVRSQPSVVFEFWGSYRMTDSNIGGSADQQMEDFVGELKAAPNVVLHGPVPNGRLATELQRMDAFLICYDIQKDQSKGTNYHKVMEYLSTGKVIVSSNITTYSDRPQLVQMTRERDNNDRLPELFARVIGDIGQYNTDELRQERYAYAFNNTYKKQLERIDALLEKKEYVRQ
ncbi:MAG TPA: hypothetical protein VNW04_04775 [Puia sp.]|jgi:hypothetical protein|nr:hypothetical protein [Puia sp.]